VTVKTFMIFQKIYISNEYCPFVFSENNASGFYKTIMQKYLYNILK